MHFFRVNNTLSIKIASYVYIGENYVFLGRKVPYN